MTQFKKSAKKVQILSFLAILCVMAVAQHPAKTNHMSSREESTTFSTTRLADDSNQSIPLGNGDIGINVWVEKNGDILFYISKSDAWSRNMETLKVGKVRISLASKPFVPGQVVQIVKAHEGTYTVQVQRKEGGETGIVAWVDANHPQILFDITSTEKEHITVSNELMRPRERVIPVPESPWKACESNIAYAMQPAQQKTITLAKDEVISTDGDHVAWCHDNRESLWEENIRMNWMDAKNSELYDPLTNYAFGAYIQGTGLKKSSETTLETWEPQRRTTIAITVFRSKVNSTDEWYRMIKKVAEAKRPPYERRLADHKNWWKNKYENSYISINGSSEARYVSLCYNLQRYVSLAAGRGHYPIRFNGSIFTYDHSQTAPLGGKENFGADYRRWGSLLFIQNTRLNYWPMLVSGDLDTMDPLFDHIQRITPALKLNAINYGLPEKEGALATFEAMTLWGTACTGQVTQAGTFQELYEKSWALQYHASALELLLLAVDRYHFSPEEAFLHQFLLPFADGVLKFYDAFFPKINGKMQIRGNALETYSQTINPAPDIAGLKKNLESLLAIDGITGERRFWYMQLLQSVPDIPLRRASEDHGMLSSMVEKYGHWVDFSKTARVSKDHEWLIDAAEEVPNAAWNMENPELYTIFPYRLYHIGNKTADPEGYRLAQRTYLDRVFQQDMGWCQDPVQAAWLGLTEEAKQRVVKRFNARLPHVLFPVFWKPSYDWSPDQDN